MGKFLIVGLGNPGKEYEGTRHNVGFEVVDLFARKYGSGFKKKLLLKGLLAEARVGEAIVFLLKPMTYMNLSGEALAETMSYFKIDLARLLVVVDDVDIPFGELRLRIQGGPGTHNGLKSVSECLQTDRYARLRVGVGDRKEGDLADYVLSKFSGVEREQLPQILEGVLHSLELFIDRGITRAMDFANAFKSPSNPSKEIQ